jgi:hypothetical protein
MESHTPNDIPECRSLQREEYDVLEVGFIFTVVSNRIYTCLVLVYLSAVCFKPSSGHVNTGDTSGICRITDGVSHTGWDAGKSSRS